MSHSRSWLRRVDHSTMTDERSDSGGDGETESRCERGKHEAFREELADETETRCAERAAEGGLVAARDGAGELEVSDVGAGDEEHCGDAGEKDEKQRAVISCDVTLERLDFCMATSKKVRKGRRGPMSAGKEEDL